MDVKSHNLIITQRCLLHLLSCGCGRQVDSKRLQHVDPPPTPCATTTILPVPKPHVFNILLSCSCPHTSCSCPLAQLQLSTHKLQLSTRTAATVHTQASAVHTKAAAVHIQAAPYSVRLANGCIKIQSQNVPAYSLAVLKISISAFRRPVQRPPPPPRPHIFSGFRPEGLISESRLQLE